MNIEVDLATGLLPLRKSGHAENSFQAILNQDDQDQFHLQFSVDS